LPKDLCSYQITEGIGGISMKGGCQSAMVELISGVAPQASLIPKNSCDLIIDEPFIFALNDQDLEFN
jgi:hypothetical protein